MSSDAATRPVDHDEHPLDCEGCPDCTAWHDVDVEPVRFLPGPGWAKRNAELGLRPGQ